MWLSMFDTTPIRMWSLLMRRWDPQYVLRRNKPIDGDDWKGPPLLGVRRERERVSVGALGTAFATALGSC